MGGDDEDGDGDDGDGVAATQLLREIDAEWSQCPTDTSCHAGMQNLNEHREDRCMDQ